MRSRTLTMISAAVVAVFAFGCEDRDDLGGERKPIPGLAARGSEHEVPVGDSRVVYDLYDNRASAVVHAGGALVIDCGSPDFAKYVEGGYRSPWRMDVTAAGEDAALVDGLGGELYAPIDEELGGDELTVSFRARAAVPDQLVSVFLNEHKLGDVSLPKAEWKTYAVSAGADDVIAGENKLRFYFRSAGEIAGTRTAAAVSEIRIGARSSRGGLDAGPAIHGGARLDALRVSGRARLSYYVFVPRRDPAIVFSVAGDGAVRVAAAVEGSAATTLWKGEAGESWGDHRVSLDDFAGRVARIDLVSEGAVDWGRPALVARPPEREPPSREAADHVIVWTVASLRDDRFAGDEVPTPGFARFAEQAVRFARVSAAAPRPGPAHVAMLAGVHPRGGSVPERAKTLAERFGEAGFATALVSGNGFVYDGAGFARGFDEYDNPMRRSHPFAARVLWQRARRFLQRNEDGHAFVYLATVEPHLPYTPSAEHIAAEHPGARPPISPAATAKISERAAAGTQHLGADERAFIEALYDAEVRDADAAFGAMLADLDELGLADRTAVIVVGDHGEELFERGQFGHGRTLHGEELRVPLAIRAPGLAGGRTVRAAVGTVDVYATALDLAGITAGPGNQGASVLALAAAPPSQPLPVFSHLPRVGRALELGRYKLIVPLHGAHALYDLHDDPGEATDVAGERPLAVRYLRNAFGLGVAYEQAWSRERWGTPANTTAAFAGDHDL